MTGCVSWWTIWKEESGYSPERPRCVPGGWARNEGIPAAGWCPATSISQWERYYVPPRHDPSSSVTLSREAACSYTEADRQIERPVCRGLPLLTLNSVQPGPMPYEHPSSGPEASQHSSFPGTAAGPATPLLPSPLQLRWAGRTGNVDGVPLSICVWDPVPYFACPKERVTWPPPRGGSFSWDQGRDGPRSPGIVWPAVCRSGGGMCTLQGLHYRATSYAVSIR